MVMPVAVTLVTKEAATMTAVATVARRGILDHALLDHGG